MGTVTSQQILDSLKQCMDPEIPINVVDMGLIYGVDVSADNKIDIKMTMTTRGCPLHDTLVNVVKQEDGSLVLMNEHEQGFMVNQAIIDFWKLCNGQRKITDLVDAFAQMTGLQRGQVEKEVIQLIQQLHEGGLVIIGEPE